MKQKSFFKILYRFPEFSGNLVQDNNLIVNFVFRSELTTLVLDQREGHVCILCLLKYTQTHTVHHLTTHSFTRLSTSSAHSQWPHNSHAPCSHWIHPEFIPQTQVSDSPCPNLTNHCTMFTMDTSRIHTTDSTLRLPMSQFDKSLHHLHNGYIQNSYHRLNSQTPHVPNLINHCTIFTMDTSRIHTNDSTLRLPMSQFDESLHHLTSACFWST